jgi:hypothetical protein
MESIAENNNSSSKVNGVTEFDEALTRSLILCSLSLVHTSIIRYMSLYFTKLFENHNILSEDRQKITEVLNSTLADTLTVISVRLKENIVKQHAARLLMYLKYPHYFSNESSESILDAFAHTSTITHTLVNSGICNTTISCVDLLKVRGNCVSQKQIIFSL